MTEKDQISSAGLTVGNTLNENKAEVGSNNNFLATPSKETRDVYKNSSTTDVDLEKSEQQTETAEELPPRDITGWKWAVVVLSILSSTFLFALDNTIVADIQSVIVLHFNDFNTKWTYILCVMLFELGSAICGAAPSIDALIIGRAICGVSGSGMYVGVMTLLAATTTIHERPIYIGGTGLAWGLGTVLGPAFYTNLCIGAVCVTVYLFMLPNKDPRPGIDLVDRAREMDYVGSVLTIGAFISGVMAVSFGGFFQSRTMLILFAMIAFTRNDTALKAGVRLLPFIMLMIFAVVGNGAILSAYGYYMPWYTLGGLLCITGGALIYTVDTETSVSRVYGYSIIIGFGDGLFAQTSFSVVQAIVDPQLIASAVGFITCAQVSGVTITLAIASSIFLNKSQNSIAELLPGTPLAEVQQAIAGAGSAFVASLSDVVKTEVLKAIVTAISKTYILVITAGVLATVLSLGMKRERLFIAAGHTG
ncbi:major facilitator superfamily domain-containing protein [Halenospora varia]|nr:major facilitator superfamily domain-containing protein [Halenospora varia]